ncbi:hypothetical protein A3J91_04535 [Candidatus Peribacteria bacterium RIFOXYC2_FULL_58_10]|nr:MAG: hypothetical protein A3J91_04535 [Candidatus Peribacteria bacterium RIFOXYC2_FULL_58_10]OGJ83980.1 MAG: hypothetical protein A2529_04245 [Candidatus Peribacteria bacterium RIFOXYD2_FULL_58_15]
MLSDSLFREARMLREVPAEGPRNAAEKVEAERFMENYRKRKGEATRVEERLKTLREAHPDDPELGRDRVRGEARRLAAERSLSRNFSALGYPKNLTDKYVTNIAQTHNIAFGLRGSSLVVTRAKLDDVNSALDDMQALTVEFKNRGLQRIESAYGAVTPLNRGKRETVTVDEHNRQYAERVKEAELGDMVIKALSDCRAHFTKYDGTNFRNSVNDPTWIADNPERYREVAMQAFKQDPENIKYFDETVFPEEDLHRIILQQLNRNSSFILHVPNKWRDKYNDAYRLAVTSYAGETGDPALLETLRTSDWGPDDVGLKFIITKIVARDLSLLDQLNTRCRFYVDSEGGMGNVVRELLTKDEVLKNENILDMVIAKRMTFEAVESADPGYGRSTSFEGVLEKIYAVQPGAAMKYLMFFPQERLSEEGDEEVRQLFEKIAADNPKVMEKFIVDYNPKTVLTKYPALLRFAPANLKNKFSVTRELAKTSPWALFNLSDTLCQKLDAPGTAKEKEDRSNYEKLVLKAFEGAKKADFETALTLYGIQRKYLVIHMPNVWNTIREDVKKAVWRNDKAKELNEFFEGK